PPARTELCTPSLPDALPIYEAPGAAVRRLVELVAERARIGAGAAVCDVGCGYGGTARQLAAERDARVTGWTLSAAQHDFAVRHQDRKSTRLNSSHVKISYAV